MENTFVNPAERRKHLRINSRIPIYYRKIETDTQEFKGSLMRNISAGGARITVHEFLALNSKVALKIPLISARKPVQGACRVAWVAKTPFSEQYDVGVEFANLNQGDEGQIAKFVFDKSTEKV